MATAYLPPEIARVDLVETNQEFWKACRRHELRIRRCNACGTFQHPPRAVCPNCLSSDIEWAQVPGTGTVYTYTVVHHGVGGLKDVVPFVIVLVELDEAGVRFISNLVDTDPGDVAVGQRVELVWEDVAEDLSVPRFRRAGD